MSIFSIARKLRRLLLGRRAASAHEAREHAGLRVGVLGRVGGGGLCAAVLRLRLLGGLGLGLRALALLDRRSRGPVLTSARGCGLAAAGRAGARRCVIVSAGVLLLELPSE
jgi:hypothetical protein